MANDIESIAKQLVEDMNTVGDLNKRRIIRRLHSENRMVAIPYQAYALSIILAGNGGDVVTAFNDLCMTNEDISALFKDPDTLAWMLQELTRAVKSSELTEVRIKQAIIEGVDGEAKTKAQLQSVDQAIRVLGMDKTPTAPANDIAITFVDPSDIDNA